MHTSFLQTATYRSPRMRLSPNRHFWEPHPGFPPARRRLHSSGQWAGIATSHPEGRGEMHRQMGQPSLAESLLPQTLGRNECLERIGDEVDWERFAALVEGVYCADEGRPSYLPLMMVKVLLLEQWYNLSDPQMEEALGDRISFRRFVELGLQDDTPDYSTISRFRTELSKAWSGRGSVQGAGVPTGQAWPDIEGRDVDGRHTGRGPSASSGV